MLASVSWLGIELRSDHVAIRRNDLVSDIVAAQFLGDLQRRSASRKRIEDDVADERIEPDAAAHDLLRHDCRVFSEGGVSAVRNGDRPNLTGVGRPLLLRELASILDVLR